MYMNEENQRDGEEGKRIVPLEAGNIQLNAPKVSPSSSREAERLLPIEEVMWMESMERIKIWCMYVRGSAE